MFEAYLICCICSIVSWQLMIFYIIKMKADDCRIISVNFHYQMRSQGEDLDFAYESISAFSTRRDNQEAVFGAEEGLKDIRYIFLHFSSSFATQIPRSEVLTRRAVYCWCNQKSRICQHTF